LLKERTMKYLALETAEREELSTTPRIVERSRPGFGSAADDEALRREIREELGLELDDASRSRDGGVRIRTGAAPVATWK
jgi:8-oxo-dGTP pyrophosphatase MutT (NUDIX family)